MSNVKRGDRAEANPDRPLRRNETIEEQKDGSVLSVVLKEPRTVTDPKTGEERVMPSSDATTSRVDMPGDRDKGDPWYLKHMVPCKQREEVLALEAGAKEAEAEARAKFEAERDAQRPVNPIRARVVKKKAKVKSNG